MATGIRYYEDGARLSAHKAQLEHDCVFTYEQIRDVLGLVKKHEWPDGTYGDNECELWSLIREVLGDQDW